MLVSLNLLLRSYRVHFNRCLIVILAMLFAVAGLSAVLVLNDTAKRSYQQATQPLLSGVRHRVVAKTGNALTKSDYASLRRLGFINLVPVLSQTVSFFTSPDGQQQTARFVGMDPFAMLSLPPESRAGATKDSGPLAQFFVNTWQKGNLLVHPTYAKELKLQSDDEIFFTAEGTSAVMEITDASGMGRQILTDIAVLQALLNTEEITALFVVNGKDIGKLTENLPNHLKLESTNSGNEAVQLTDSFHLNLLAMALLMFVVCMFVAMNALHLLLIKRLANLKILRQLGVRIHSIVLAMLIEVGLLCLLLTPVGILLGIELAGLLSPSVYRTLESLYSVRISFDQLSFFSLWVKCFITALIGALIASSLPILQLKQNLSKTGTMSLITNQDRIWRNLFLVFSLSACALLVSTKGMIWSFLIVALLVFSGCAAVLYSLPLLLLKVNTMIPLKYSLIRWSIADSLRISSHSKIAYCAFFIAVATNIGMNLMVDSFRQATDSWLTQRLNADAYIYTESPIQLVNWAQRNAQSIQLEPRYTSQGNLGDTQIDIFSYPDSQQFRQAMTFDFVSGNIWDSFQQGTGVLINQQLANSFGYKLNSNIRFNVGEKSFQKKVVGIYFDYGNPKKQLLLPTSEMKLLDADNRMFAVFSDTPYHLRAFETQLNKVDFELNFYKTEELLGLSMQTFDQTFTITKSLNIVTLLVAVFSLVTSILIIDMDNQKQRALMRSFGVTKLTLLFLGLGQYIILSTIVCLFAIPFGTLLSWLLINLINVQAFQWSYPLIINSSVIYWVIGLSLLTTAVGTLLPMLKNNQRSLNQEIKCLL